MSDGLTRGERNNNPGNIDKSSIRWEGLAAVQPDPRFCAFSDPKWGIRALAVILLNYQRRYGLSTVRQIINRWAPPVENNTTAYVDAVAADVGVSADATIALSNADTLTKLVTAVIRHENGRVNYTSEQINAGIGLALEKESKMSDTQTVMVPVQVAAPQQASTTVKPGAATTEHILTWVGVALSVVGVLTKQLPPDAGAAVMATLIGLYTAARTGVKAAHSLGLARAVPDLPSLPTDAGAPK